jgi:hypothetical protein
VTSKERAKVMTMTLVDIIGPYLDDATGRLIPWERIERYVETELSDLESQRTQRAVVGMFKALEKFS